MLCIDFKLKLKYIAVFHVGNIMDITYVPQVWQQLREITKR